ncbi:hypothetical protein ACNYDF_16990 [Klebsiella aerogenes]|uniref:hypothetical protein n=1 Tax=Klebsiella aerogenes TaxID=548 RepID=UPI0037A16FF8
MDLNTVITKLMESGWKAEPLNIAAVKPLTEALNTRLHNIPELLYKLIFSFQYCTNKEDTAWFVVRPELLKEYNDDPFSWDEFERLSYDAAIDDSDRERVSSFWRGHFCFFMSVKSGYVHISVVTKGQDAGRIVFGYEPDFEAVSVLANSIEEFFVLLIEHISGIKENEYLGCIL